MHNYYEDIIEAVGKEPIWFDEYAVPRYCKFSPEVIANIYANEAALVEIKCQACGHSFLVAISSIRYDLRCLDADITKHKLAKAIVKKQVYYGDPPNIQCCPAGATMTSDAIRVLEYWTRDNLEWKRNKKYEIKVGTWQPIDIR